jgi:hypothetical protein
METQLAKDMLIETNKLMLIAFNDVKVRVNVRNEIIETVAGG